MKPIIASLGLLAFTFLLSNCQCLSTPLQATSYVHARDEYGTIQYHGVPSSLFTKTGMMVHQGQHVTIEYLHGGWNASPNRLWDGPAGHPQTRASRAYPMPGYPVGMLMARVGDGPLMPWTEPRLSFIADRHGEIELGINDLVSDQAGRNNSGRLKMRVTVHPIRRSNRVHVEEDWYYPAHTYSTPVK